MPEQLHKKRVIKILESLGLHKNEVYIYLDLLASPNSSALDISKRTGIHRPNVYDALRTLAEKGFAEESVNERTAKFNATNIDCLRRHMEEQQKKLDSVIETLKSSAVRENEDEGVFIIKGAMTIREEIRSLVNKKSPIMIEGADKQTIRLLTDDFLDELNKAASKDKVSVRVIITCDRKCEGCEKFFLKGFEARYLPIGSIRGNATIISGNTVIFVLYSSPPQAIKIKNRAVAFSHENNFNFLWKYADAKPF